MAFHNIHVQILQEPQAVKGEKGFGAQTQGGRPQCGADRPNAKTPVRSRQPVVRRTHYSCRELECGSQHLEGDSTVCNSSSKDSDTFFWSLRALSFACVTCFGWLVLSSTLYLTPKARTNPEKAKIWLSIGGNTHHSEVLFVVYLAVLLLQEYLLLFSSRGSGRTSFLEVTLQTAQGINDWVWMHSSVTSIVQEKVFQGGHLRHMAPTGSGLFSTHLYLQIPR